jgi:hypothetical protein
MFLGLVLLVFWFLGEIELKVGVIIWAIHQGSLSYQMDSHHSISDRGKSIKEWWKMLWV